MADDVRELAGRVLEMAATLWARGSNTARRRGGALSGREYVALSLLHHRGGVLGVADLRAGLRLHPAQATRLLESLERHAAPGPYVRRELNPDNRRMVNVTLTAAGEGALREHAAPRLDALADALLKVTPEQRAALGTALAVLGSPPVADALR